MLKRHARSLLGKLSFVAGLVPALRPHVRALWGGATKGRLARQVRHHLRKGPRASPRLKNTPPPRGLAGQ
eukprot:7075782-Alexandrium_andersonii.AAC.1